MRTAINNRWLLIGSVIALAAIGTVVNHGSNVIALKANNAAPSVTIGAPIPLPTTSTQSGQWNVGIMGTPTVTVGNSDSNPLPTRAVDNPDLHPMLLAQSGSQSGFAFMISSTGNLVIEQVMMRCLEPSAAFALTDFELDVSVGNLPGSFFFAPAALSLPGSVTEMIVNQTTHIYASGGTNVILETASPAPAGTHCDASVSGHLVGSSL